MKITQMLKKEEKKDGERVAIFYVVLLQWNQEQNFSPKVWWIFGVFKLNTHKKMQKVGGSWAVRL